MAAGLTVGRSPALRLVSLVALLLFGTAVATRLAAGDTGAGCRIAAALALLALTGTISAWGDRFTLDDAGIEYRNLLLGRFLSRRLAWGDVLRVQVHRSPGDGAGGPPRALFLVPRAGRRMALDALQDFEEVRRFVARRTAVVPATPPAVSTPPADRLP